MVLFPSLEATPLSPIAVLGLTAFMTRFDLFFWPTPAYGLCGWISFAVSTGTLLAPLIESVADAYDTMTNRAKDVEDTHKVAMFSARMQALYRLAGSVANGAESARGPAEGWDSELADVSDEWFKPMDGYAVCLAIKLPVCVVTVNYDDDLSRYVAAVNCQAELFLPQDNHVVLRHTLSPDTVKFLPTDVVTVILDSTLRHCNAALSAQKFVDLHRGQPRPRRRNSARITGTRPHKRQRMAGKIPETGKRRSVRQACARNRKKRATESDNLD